MCKPKLNPSFHHKGLFHTELSLTNTDHSELQSLTNTDHIVYPHKVLVHLCMKCKSLNHNDLMQNS